MNAKFPFLTKFPYPPTPLWNIRNDIMSRLAQAMSDRTGRVLWLILLVITSLGFLCTLTVIPVLQAEADGVMCCGVCGKKKKKKTARHCQCHMVTQFLPAGCPYPEVWWWWKWWVFCSYFQQKKGINSPSCFSFLSFLSIGQAFHVKSRELALA